MYYASSFIPFTKPIPEAKKIKPSKSDTMILFHAVEALVLLMNK